MRPINVPQWHKICSRSAEDWNLRNEQYTKHQDRRTSRHARRHRQTAFSFREYEDESKIRALIDKRRHAAAQLQTEIEANSQISQYPSDNIYDTNPQIQEFIYAWCSRVQKASQDILTFQNYKFCNLFIDHILPQKWHFDNDVINCNFTAVKPRHQSFKR